MSRSEGSEGSGGQGGVAALGVARSGRDQSPVPVGAGQSEDEEPSKVQGGDPVVQPVVILGDSAVPDPSVAASEPGDRPFHHGPVGAVDLLELRRFRLPTGGPEQGFVFMDLDGATGGAPRRPHDN